MPHWICSQWMFIYHKDKCSTVFTATLFVHIPEPVNILSPEKWATKLWHIYTMEYYTVDKNNYILKFMCKFLDLENIIKDRDNPDPERKI